MPSRVRCMMSFKGTRMWFMGSLGRMMVQSSPPPVAVGRYAFGAAPPADSCEPSKGIQGGLSHRLGLPTASLWLYQAMTRRYIFWRWVRGKLFRHFAGMKSQSFLSPGPLMARPLLRGVRVWYT